MKILIVHNYYKIPGGEDIVVSNEKKILSNNGHEVFEYMQHNSEIRENNLIRKIKLGMESLFSIRTYTEVKKIIKEKEIDLVHVHNTIPIVSPSVYYAAIINKKPVVQTLHNFRLVCPNGTLFNNGAICKECLNSNLKKAIKFKCYRNSRMQTLIIVFMLKIHRIIGTYNKISAYIALTEFDKKILQYSIEGKKIFIKPNFTYRSKINIEKEKYFMYVGRLESIKGIDILIQNWKCINDSILYIFGDGPLKEDLINNIKKNNIKGIIFKGHQGHETIMEYLSKAAALIVPSQCYESFGMVIIEAFSVGTPVIGNNVGSIASLIKNNINGLLFNKNEELIEKINLIKNNYKLVEKLIRGAKESFEEYTPEKNYTILMNIYNNAIDNKLRG